MKTIIEMAREVGIEEAFSLKQDQYLVRFKDDSLERFATLVRADERDRMCEQFNISKELAHEKAKGNETD